MRPAAGLVSGKDDAMTQVYTASDLLVVLKMLNCFNDAGKLLHWPEWLSYHDVRLLINADILIEKHYAKLYNHTDYILHHRYQFA